MVIKQIFTSMEKNVIMNVTRGKGVGSTENVSSWTRPPVNLARTFSPNHPWLFQITDSILSKPAYKAQAFAAQYACKSPRLNGNNLDKTWKQECVQQGVKL